MHYCSQEKEKGALLFLREENRDTIVIRRKLMLSCSQGEGNWCYTAYVFRKRGLVFYSFQEKGTGALSTTVFRIGEGNRCSNVFRRREQVQYCSQEKETGALLFSGEEIWCSKLSKREGNWCSTDLWIKKLVLY